ncbi:MAG: glycosyltransferase family 39 protein [Aquificae bacterium]|nr:glycosyltransferase family 39 protein [Aquificota bacterium]
MTKKLLVFSLLALVYFTNLSLNAVWIPNESFYADGARNMLKTGDFLTPVYNGELRLNKPPLTYWLSALGFTIFGVNELGLRFFQALLGLLSALIVYLLAKDVTRDEETALLSSLAFGLSFIVVANARYTSPEIPLTFFITLSLYLWHKYYTTKKTHLFWLAIGSSSLAVLTKGPVGFALPAGIIFIFLLLENPKELLKLRYYAGTLTVLITSGWWFAYQYITHKEEFLRIFIKENIKRIYALQSDPVYTYILDLNVSFLPYSLLFFPALAFALLKKRQELKFPLVWFLTTFTLFSLVKMKIPVYVMPAYPAVAIITARYLTSDYLPKLKNTLLVFLGTLLLVALFALAVLFKPSPLLVPLSILPLVFLFKRKLINYPAVAGFSFLLYLALVILPFVEEKRPYREVGARIKAEDPKALLRTYEIGHFHHNLPFYAERVIIRNAKEPKPPALVLAKEGSLKCEPVESWELYTGSESRFFRFLLDIKRNKRFYKFNLCKLPEPARDFRKR